MNFKATNAKAKQVVCQGISKGVTVAGAESCTGGLVAKLLTDIPGSSAVFCGACVTYTNEVKEAVLGVAPEIILRHTEISYACAEAMAEGARRTFGSDLAYSTTGYAGPGGGTESDPVGTVYVGISTTEGVSSYRITVPNATRTQVRNQAAAFVLEKLLERMQ